MIPLGVLAAAGRTSETDSGLWSPANLAVPFWLYDESEITFYPAEDNEVSQWGFISDGIYVGQTTEANRPELVASGLNGRRYVEFNSGTTAHRMTRNTAETQALFKNRSNAWLFGVHRKRASDAGVNRQIFIGYDSGTSTRIGVRCSSTVGANRIQFLAKRLDADSASSIVATTDMGTDWYMWLAIMDWSTGTGYIYINGELDTSGSVTSAGTTSNTDAVGSSGVPLVVGNNAGGTTNADIDLAELICNVDQVLDTDDIDNLFGYAAHRWGLASELPAEHPYKDAPPGGGLAPPDPEVESLWVGATE